MKTSVKTIEVSLTIEEVAKVRHFGKSENDGFIFLLIKGLTNPKRKLLSQKFLPRGLTNLKESAHD